MSRHLALFISHQENGSIYLSMNVCVQKEKKNGKIWRIWRVHECKCQKAKSGMVKICIKAFISCKDMKGQINKSADKR